MASRHEQVVADLRDESADLLASVAPLADADWARATPAVGWSVQDQLNHLAWFDESAALAVTDPAEFRAGAAGLTGDFPDLLVSRQRGMPPAATLSWFRTARAAFLSVAAATDGASRLPWYGTTMSLTSSVTARLMETWAHGQDVADALGVTRTPTARLRHVCHLGVATRAHSFRLRDLPVPTVDVLVELSAPDGALWTWGSAADGQVVRGSALDFCLVVTQRRHLAGTGLSTEGSVAATWLTVAQAYAGLPGPGRGTVLRPSSGERT
jgi:uncharacterized protein (TIGR03084 family)